MNRIFRNGTNYYKDHTFYTCADNDGSIFSLSDRDEHRARRKALSPRFSKQAAEADAPGILRQLRRMEYFMVQQSTQQKSCNINDLFRAFATCEDYTRPRMNKPIRTDLERNKASVIELLVAHSHDVTGKPPDLDYLAAEAFTFIDAGVDTAGRTLAAAVYHVLRNPEIEENLRHELDEAKLWGDGNNEADVHKLGNLPYLNAVIKEAHRIWPALPGPLPRVVPPEGLQVGAYFIPAGTIISATHHSLHSDETIFPEPTKFKPERWLRDDRTDPDRYLNPYSRGSRACIGINLAQIQLQLALADLFYRLDMELCEPIPSALAWKDHFVAEPTGPIYLRARFRAGNLM
ncbi:benzoate 4-monooxygenase cytochrome P450 [Aspergillus udagawae]|nr:benzoate 4-monooxygenase cytochrome P450 [Aspergillus udagawae]